MPKSDIVSKWKSRPEVTGGKHPRQRNSLPKGTDSGNAWPPRESLRGLGGENGKVV